MYPLVGHWSVIGPFNKSFFWVLLGCALECIMSAPLYFRCFQDCVWGAWSVWGSCPTCGGQRYRHRTIEVTPQPSLKDDIGRLGTADHFCFSSEMDRNRQPKISAISRFDHSSSRIFRCDDVWLCFPNSSLGKRVFGSVFRGKRRFSDWWCQVLAAFFVCWYFFKLLQ